MIRKFLAALVLVLALGVAGVLVAQNRMGGMHGGMMQMMRDCPMMQGMAQSPAAALDHRDELGLTDAQVQRLQALRAATEQTHAQAMKGMTALHEQIAGATAGDRFDEAATRAAFDRMGDLHAETGVAMLRTRHRVRQLLSPEQRTKLDELGGGGMMGMGGMMGGMEMPNCPMHGGSMQGGMDSHSGQHDEHGTPVAREGAR